MIGVISNKSEIIERDKTHENWAKSFCLFFFFSFAGEARGERNHVMTNYLT